MIQVLITLQCDECKHLFEEFRWRNDPHPHELPFIAEELCETAATSGWHLNFENSQDLCIDCAWDLPDC